MLFGCDDEADAEMSLGRVFIDPHTRPTYNAPIVERVIYNLTRWTMGVGSKALRRAPI